MKTQKFKLKQGEDIRVGNSISWHYNYDGEVIRFFNNGRNWITEKCNLPEGTIVVFKADGRDSYFGGEIKKPKNFIKRSFWEHGWYAGHRIDIKKIGNSRREFRIIQDSASGEYLFKDRPDYNEIKPLEGWQHAGYAGGYRDMMKDGKIILSAAAFRDSYRQDVYRWWYAADGVTKEDVEIFFNGINEVL